MPDRALPYRNVAVHELTLFQEQLLEFLLLLRQFVIETACSLFALPTREAKKRGKKGVSCCQRGRRRVADSGKNTQKRHHSQRPTCYAIRTRSASASMRVCCSSSLARCICSAAKRARSCVTCACVVMGESRSHEKPPDVPACADLTSLAVVED